MNATYATYGAVSCQNYCHWSVENPEFVKNEKKNRSLLEYLLLQFHIFYDNFEILHIKVKRDKLKLL